ncbi:MAG: Ig-like domain-containing protein, partial [Flavobacteriales bacterium]
MQYKWTFLFLVPFLLAACAQVGTITGGDKDEAAPELVVAVPANGTTGFIGNSIVLEFNERIQLDRVRERLLISPPLDVAPDVKISGAKRVTIQLNAALKPNTTYSFLIGEAIKDLTEGNIAKGLSYVISTGDHLDSLELVGRVTNAYSGKPEKDVLVMVHDQADTSTIRTGRPAYATRTLEDGTYHLNYLRTGDYLLYALHDQNANYRFDLPNEEVAFMDGPVIPTYRSSADTIMPIYDLKLFREKSSVQQVREYKVVPDGAFQIVFAKPAEQASLRDLIRIGSSLQWTPEWNDTRDTVLFWPNDTTGLSEGSYELRTDVVLDTLSYRTSKKIPFFTGLNSASGETADSALITIRAARPLTNIDQERISVIRDSVPIGFMLTRDSVD